MKSSKTLILTILACGLSWSGCATIPSERVPQPWVRSLKSTEALPIGSKLQVEVSGKTLPLLGDEQLTAEKIHDKLSYLLKRRGFIVDQGPSDYAVRLTYKSDRTEQFRFSSSVSTTNSTSYAVGLGAAAGSKTGLGVSIARAVSAFATKTTTTAEQSAAQVLTYIHTIAIEISTREGTIVWKGESTWDSDDLDLIFRITPVLQRLLSDLPSNQSYRPEVSEVKESRVLNYYRLECQNNWFTCPALPYRIYLQERSAGRELKSSILNVVSNPYAFAAYVDLIQTAEFALPKGSEREWTEPIKAALWENVTLGGQYLIGPTKRPINVLIKLDGKSDGYYINECYVASDEQYAEFQELLTSWRAALSDYYDVYVQP